MRNNEQTANVLEAFAKMIDGWVENKSEEYDNTDDEKKAYSHVSEELKEWAKDYRDEENDGKLI